MCILPEIRKEDGMFRNYFKVAIRNLLQQKTYSFINIIGLTVGIAACLLILLWVRMELSYDRFHPDADRIYRVGSRVETGEDPVFVQTMGGPVAPALGAEYPEVEAWNRYTMPSRASISVGTQKFSETVLLTDPSFLKLFSFPVIYGDAAIALTDVSHAVLTRSLAERLFGVVNPIGKTITMDGQYQFQVAAVVQDPPVDSSIRFDILLPFELAARLGYHTDSWGSNDYYSHILLAAGTDVRAFTRKILNRQNSETGLKTSLFLFPLTHVHLYDPSGSGGRIWTVTVFSLVALLILLIASFNFINLTTARAMKRAREVGIRKVVGGTRNQIMLQFLWESLLLTLVSVFLALCLIELILPYFNDLAGSQLTVDIIRDPFILMVLIPIVLVTGLFSGSYPALLLSGLKPTRVLRGSIQIRGGGQSLRKAIVIGQFAVSVILLFATIVLIRQVTFLKTKDTGVNQKNVICIDATDDMANSYLSMRNEWLRQRGVVGVTTSFSYPTYMGMFDASWQWKGKPADTQVHTDKGYVGPGFADMFGLKMVDGRFFSRDYPADFKSGVVINESLAALMTGNPIGQTLTRGSQVMRVIGVVKNFHYLPLSRKIGPLMIFGRDHLLRKIFIRIDDSDVKGTVGRIRNVFTRHNPTSDMSWSFLEERYEASYRKEREFGRVLTHFAILAILISCLGLFGLTTYTTEQRSKEVGIRKVLGATVRQITLLFSRDYLVWVLIASLIAWPIAWLLMTRWLEVFANRIHIGPGTFLLSGLLGLLIAGVTVSVQTIKTALANPVDALKME
jgi:putative ABC transport system permease protein